MNDLRITFEAELRQSTAQDIREFSQMLPASNRLAIKEFCSWFSLDKWYEEALLLHNPNINSWLLEVADEAEKEERELAAEDRMIEQSLRIAQGW